MNKLPNNLHKNSNKAWPALAVFALLCNAVVGYMYVSSNTKDRHINANTQQNINMSNTENTISISQNEKLRTKQHKLTNTDTTQSNSNTKQGNNNPTNKSKLESDTTSSTSSIPAIITKESKKQEEESTLLSNNQKSPVNNNAQAQHIETPTPTSNKKQSPTKKIITNINLDNKTKYQTKESIDLNSLPTQKEILDASLLTVDLPAKEQRKIATTNPTINKLQTKTDNLKSNTEELQSQLSDTIKNIKDINQQKIERDKQMTQRAYANSQLINKLKQQELSKETGNVESVTKQADLDSTP